MVVADTNLFIAAMRNHAMAQSLMQRYAPRVALALVTKMELAIGATNPTKRAALAEILRSHAVLPLNRAIGMKALHLIEQHNTARHRLFLGDALIAATCLHHGYPLLTFNTDDFRFIKGLQLAG